MKKPSFIFAFLLITTVALTQDNSRYIEATDFVEIVKLPKTSWIYPDTFAIYWKLPQTSQHIGKTSIKFKYATIFADYPFEFDYTRDSLVTIILDYHYQSESAMILERTLAVGTKVVYDGSEAIKLLKIIQKDAEIEAIRSLLEDSYSFNSLMVLADVYEKKQCFVNAYYVYKKLMTLDTEKGRKEFYAFFRRNSKKLNPRIKYVHR